MARPRVNVAPLIIKAFHAMFEAVMSGCGGEWWMKGGRGSTKSTFISLCIVLVMITFPFANGVVVRRFGNTLRDSVYAQVCWAIAVLGLDGYFICHASPMEIIYKPTGQKLVFRGMDDPLKMKGVKFTKGYCAIIWFEELDQFASWEAVRSALKSFRRGGSVFWTFYSYNPPKTLWSWVNKQALEMERKPRCTVHHSTYLDVVEGGHAEWLGEDFVAEAEWLRDTNETAYRWEMLGEITGTGGSVFDEREAFRKEARDTGRLVVDALTYADEEGGKPRYHAQTVWTDDTPDGKQQTAVYRRKYSLKARPARKGNMRDLSYRYLAGLRAIHIDPVRCPRAYEEFTLKEFERDRNDEWIDEIPDGNDHSIDAVRYAMMEDVRRAA